MWLLDNKTPLAAERAWVRDKHGSEVWVVAIKGTFNVGADGQLTLAENQEPVTLAPDYTDDSYSELRYETDFFECKQATDVIVNGTAYAPNNQPSRDWAVNLRVGPIDKTLFVQGDRVWKKNILDMSVGESEFIESLPLSYRYAYGGEALSSADGSLLNADGSLLKADGSSMNAESYPSFYELNPIGRGYTQDKKALIGRYAPNIEYPKGQVVRWSDQPTPAGLAAIPGHWQARKSLAGTYDQNWEEQRQPLLPEDFDPQFYQCAPIDQQVPGFLKGSEKVELTHLTPTKHWSFYLPKVSFYLRTSFSDGYKKTHRANLHTVIIEPDAQRVMVVWHSHLPCHHRVNQLEGTQIRLKKRILEPTSDTPNRVWKGEGGVG